MDIDDFVKEEKKCILETECEFCIFREKCDV